jgi:hypothetical protein
VSAAPFLNQVDKTDPSVIMTMKGEIFAAVFWERRSVWEVRW